jgi:hypothetical protein
MKPTTSEPAPAIGKFFHPGAKPLIPVNTRMTPKGIPADADKTTRSSLAQPKAADHEFSCFPSCLGL